ncbi:MAG: 1-deoxy-D-xylulose-5-phosphate reductoisomerase [Opitutales bacterium]|nr:1-deoxy-D-xylulose-5-phosphate reductoisomerase [Opitutales bacterium]
MTARKRILLIGATGSIGTSTIEVIAEHLDELELVGIAARQNAAQLEHIQQSMQVKHCVLTERDGDEALIEMLRNVPADIVVMAMVGSAGLRPTLTAIEAGMDVALANKEVLVMAGEFVMRAARTSGVRILPIDSEHNAIFQCLEGVPRKSDIRRLVLTASGGPFRDWTLDQMANATVADAMKHPNWSMGRKINVDSASMANKGLEMIEARWLFDMPPERIDVVVHPQSIVHSMVECIDGSLLTQWSPPSMTYAIRHALFYPQRRPSSTPGVDFNQALDLNFSPPDNQRFPCLRLAKEALQKGGTAPARFNAANEIAVEHFLQKRLPFLAIPQVIEHCLTNGVQEWTANRLEDILAADQTCRKQAAVFIADKFPSNPLTHDN